MPCPPNHWVVCYCKETRLDSRLYHILTVISPGNVHYDVIDVWGVGEGGVYVGVCICMPVSGYFVIL